MCVGGGTHPPVRDPTGNDEGDTFSQAHPGLGGVLQGGQDQGEQRHHGSEDAQQPANDHQGSRCPEGTFDTKKKQLQNI